MLPTYAPEWWREDDESAAPIEVAHSVTAIVVSRNGARWLPLSLAAIRGQIRPVDRLVAVDVASTDDSVGIFRTADPSFLLELSRDTTHGQAIAAAERDLPIQEGSVEWLWLLHDDCAVEPGALDQLLQTANHFPHAAVIGSKVIDWSHAQHVLEVGQSITAIGTRYSGLEHGERDQGQHDDVSYVHAVSSVGMLVRRDVWQALGGFAPEIPHFRADMDFCWRVWSHGSEVLVNPRARARHVNATARSLRTETATGQTPHFVDRLAGAVIVMANTPRRWLWARMLLVAFAGLVRGAGYLAVQDIFAARYEWQSTVAALASRRKVRSLRSRYGSAGLMPGIKPTVGDQLAHVTSEFLNTVDRTWQRILDSLFPNRVHTDEVGLRRALIALALRPGALLGMVTLVAGVIVSRGAWRGAELVSPLTGHFPQSSAQLFAEFAAGWHAVGMGSTEAAHPLQFLLAVLGLPFGGNPASAVVVLSTFGLWFSALSMHLALRSILPHSSTRVWLAALYGLSPVVVGAAVSGNVGVLLSAIALPPTVYALRRSASSWRAAAAGSIGLAIMGSVWPALWILGAVVLVTMAVRNRTALRTLAKPVAMFFWSASLVFPWSLAQLLHPVRWFDEFGSTGQDNPSAWRALFGMVSATASISWVWSIGLVLIAAISLMDARNNRLSKAAWTFISLIMAVSLVGQAAASFWTEASRHFGLHVASLFITAALILCLASSAATARVRLARSNFGWRQIGTALAVLSVSAMPVASFAFGGFITHPSEKLQSGVTYTGETLRGYTEDFRLRTLLISTGSNGVLRADILDGRPLTFGDAAIDSNEFHADFSLMISDWLTGSAGDQNPLKQLGIGYIATPRQDPATGRISSMGSLTRLITARSDKLLNVWRVNDVISRVYVNEGADASEVFGEIAAYPSAPQFSGHVESYRKAATLHMADRYDSHWRAAMNGTELQRIAGPVNAWSIPAGTPGEIVVTYQESIRSGWLMLALASALSVLVVIAPRRRNSYTDEWLEE